MKKLGLGMMRLPLIDEESKSVDIRQTKAMIDLLMEKGYNYFDTAHPYLNGNSEKAVKETLTKRYPREYFILTSKMPIFNLESSDQMEDIFEEQIDRCGVEYFDYYLLHNVSSKHEKKFTDIDSFEFIVKKKEEGKIRHIGISSHDTPEFLEDILLKHPEIEVVQLQINYQDWSDEIINSKKCYEVACKYNKPVIVMEPLKGGALLNIPENVKEEVKVYEKEEYLSLALAFCANLENVMVILSGVNNIREVEENIRIFENIKELNDNTYMLLDKISELISESIQIKCSYCNYCISHCQNNINIPQLFRFYNSQKLLKQSHSLSMYYNNFISHGNAKASDCIKCNSCLDYCPQKINIPEMLEKIVETFE